MCLPHHSLQSCYDIQSLVNPHERYQGIMQGTPLCQQSRTAINAAPHRAKLSNVDVNRRQSSMAVYDVLRQVHMWL